MRATPGTGLGKRLATCCTLLHFSSRPEALLTTRSRTLIAMTTQKPLSVTLLSLRVLSFLRTCAAGRDKDAGWLAEAAPGGVVEVRPAPACAPCPGR